MMFMLVLYFLDVLMERVLVKSIVEVVGQVTSFFMPRHDLKLIPIYWRLTKRIWFHKFVQGFLWFQCFLSQSCQTTCFFLRSCLILHSVPISFQMSIIYILFN